MAEMMTGSSAGEQPSREARGAGDEEREERVTGDEATARTAAAASPEQTPSPASDAEPTDTEASPARALRLDSDRDLSRVGVWSICLGAIGIAIAFAFFLAGGLLPGVLVLGFALLCSIIGALALATVAHHQG
jgi:hypothetical protein